MPSRQVSSPKSLDIPCWLRHGSSVPELDQARHQPIQGINTRLLIVNDDGDLRRMVANYLEKQNIDVCWLEQRKEIFPELELQAPNLILLYHAITQHDGFSLLQEIRSRSDIPVIMVSRNSTEEADRVIGLEFGADDFLAIPFGLRELSARVRAVLRRNVRRRDLKSVVYTFAGWQLRPRTRRLLSPRGDELPLTKAEYALLSAFITAPGRILSREHLIGATRMNGDVFDRTIDVQVYRLRRKLGHDLNAQSIIKTERGVGYRFQLAVQQVAFR